MKLSIIIPVYNVAPYVRKCVESVLAQDLDPQEYEVILVDDGSTDGSGEICDSLTPGPSPEERGVNVVVIHQENQGLSAARNAGIAVAKGKYIQFVDSDDYLEPNVLGGLVEQMEREQLDVLRFDYQNTRISAECTMHDARWDARNVQYEVFEPYKTPRQVDQCTEIVDGETYLNTRMGYACYAWQFMIRRELLDNCIFTPGIYLEDTEWTPRLLMKAKRVNATTTIVYNYLTRDGSIMRNVNKAKKIHLIESLFVVNETLEKLMQTATNTQWLRGNRSDNAYSILGNVARYDYENRKMWLERLRASGVYPLVPYLCKRNTRIKYRIINLSPVLYCWLIHKHIL